MVSGDGDEAVTALLAAIATGCACLCIGFILGMREESAHWRQATERRVEVCSDGRRFRVLERAQ